MSSGELIRHSRPTIVPGAAEAVAQVITSGKHATGEIRRLLEADVQERLRAPHAVAVQSGFAALHLALLGLRVQAGDRVLCPSYVCLSLLHAIAAVGAQPVVADVDPEFFNMTPDTAREAIAREGLTEGDVRCAIVPHILGYPAPLHLWDLKIPIVEDCAMALGAQIQGEEVGVFGKVSIFSFHATKMISTGYGGLVLTADDSVAAEIRDRVHYDQREHWRPAFNYLLSDVSAALGRAQLPHLDTFIARRTLLAAQYRDAFQRLGLREQEAYPDTTPVYFRYCLLLASEEERVRLETDLAAAHVETKSAVYRPVHEYLDLPNDAFPGTTEVQRRSLSLPIYPVLSEAELDRVIQATRDSLSVR